MKVPDNLITHRTSWQKALVRLIELEPNQCSREYYEHELRAMQMMYRDLDKQSPKREGRDDDYDNERIMSGV